MLKHASPPFQALQERLRGALVLAPQAPSDPKARWDWGPYVGDMARVLRIDFRGRTLLACGFSRGGLGVLQLLSHAPEITKWAIVDPQHPAASDEPAVLAAVGSMESGWVRYGPRHDTIKEFGDRLAARATANRVCFVEMSHGEMALAAFSGDRLGGIDALYEHVGLQLGDDSERRVRALNRATFAAEDRGSGEEMSPLLSEDFAILRSTGEQQGKAQMLQRLGEKGPGATPRAVDCEAVKLFGESAVVTSRVTMRGADGNVSGGYWNTKVFARRNGDWSCRVWQVISLG